MITERQLLILQAIIDDYILTGIPVGSRTLSKRQDISFSSATIRNEMADLEEEGYLEQPHTSAGRMPSEKAYRLYVDTLMKVSALNTEEAGAIRAYFDNKYGEMEKVIRTTAKVLSDMTNMTSVVLPPQLSRIDVKRIQLVKISETKMLIIFVFNTGMIKDMMVDVGEELEPAYLEMVSNFLSEQVRDKSLAEAFKAVRAVITGEVAAHRSFMEKLLDAVAASTAGAPGSKEVILGGAQNIFNHPEYRDVDKAKNFLQLLETKDALYDMLSQATDMEFTIRIGSENDIEQLRDMSVVTATYKIGDMKLGSFGIIGPTRMNYAKVLSVMRCVGSSMNEILNGFGTNGDG